jgi:hypothetical protein
MRTRTILDCIGVSQSEFEYKLSPLIQHYTTVPNRRRYERRAEPRPAPLEPVPQRNQ